SAAARPSLPFPARRSSDLRVVVRAAAGAAAHRLGGAVVVAGLVDLCVGVVVVVGLGLRRSVAMAGLVDVGLLALVLLGLRRPVRSEEHTSELQSRENLVCR